MADMLFEMPYRMRSGDFDSYKRLKWSAVMDMFQNAACMHTDLLGCGMDDMLERGLMWAVMKLRFRALREPELYQKVRVITWPLRPDRISFRREFRIEDESGKRLIEGTSEWVLMHSAERRIMRVSGVYPESESFLNDSCFDQKLGKVENFTEEDAGYTIIPGFSDIDRNGHVNNARYADYVLDAVAPDQEKMTERFDIDFHREVLIGERLTLFKKQDGSNLLLKGMSGDKIMFSCRIGMRAE